ncbi:HAMP domain-containing sensor histidine kinase [Wukongibacter baidiensis]|uniref:sensor histidine kinase n=1 Tax=Wukongibacter baidiensis TaxID=1723361 RepID=UPI003D7F9C25
MTTSIVKKICGVEYYRLKEEERHELNVKQIEANLIIEKKLVTILFFIGVVLLYFDITKFQRLWYQNPAYKRLFYLHIAIMIVFSIFLVLVRLRNRSLKKRSIRFDKALSYGVIVSVLVWCALLSINAQFMHGQMSAYIIGAFCISSTIRMNPRSNFIIYSFSYIVFVTGLLIYQHDFNQIVGSIINSSFLIVLAIVTANIHFSNYINDFINKKIIFQKNQELENSQKNLEDSLKSRSDKLYRYNKILIDEINKRHELEMDALKNKLKYEQEKGFLNEKIEYEKLRTEFFANLSHELRTPLNVIFSAQQILSLFVQDCFEKDKSEKANKYLKIIKQNCYRLIRLIGNLIDITKIDVGSFNIEFQNHDIVNLIESIALSVSDFIKDKEISLIFKSSIDERIIACDPDKIERMILNLLSNAVKFTPKDGKIFVNIDEEDDRVIISVKDTGIGIPKEKHDSIFERFVQVDKSTMRKSEGSGIGLALVKSLVEMHGGIIRLESIEGEGSEFIIELPIRILEDANEYHSEIACTKHEKVEKIDVEFSDIYL